MKPAYSSLVNKTGIQVSGICKVEIIPISDIQSIIDTTFLEGVVSPAITTTYPPIQLDFTAGNGKHIEKLKTAKAGDYYDISVQGLCNYLSAENMRILETLRFEKVVAIITNVAKDALGNSTKRIIGNHNDGMKFQYSLENTSGSSEIMIDLNYTSDTPSPFYRP